MDHCCLALIEVWGRVRRFVLYRRKVNHETRRNFQLDLFSPEDGHFEYSAILTNRTVKACTLWHFYCGHAGHEKAYAELKSGFAFDCLRNLHEHAKFRLADAQRHRLQPHPRLPG